MRFSNRVAGSSGAAEHADHGAAMVVGPGGAIGRQRIRLEAAIAVDGRRGEHRARHRVLQKAGEIRQAERRQQLAGFFRHEQIGAARRIDQRLMQMPAAGVITLERRARHEGGEIAEPPAHLPRRGAEQQHVVGGVERGARRKRALDLSGAPFVFDGTQAKSERLVGIAERIEHRLHQIHVGFGVVVIAGLGRPGFDRTAAHAGRADILLAQMLVGDAKQIPLDLGADDARRMPRSASLCSALRSSWRGAK